MICRGRFLGDIPILIIDWSPKDISLEVKTLILLQLLITQEYCHPGICLYLVMISDLLIESSAPVWMILNDIHWCEWLSVIQTGADDSTNEYEIITRCISLSIIYTGADDSINESEIIIRCMSISIIHTGADDFINESEIMTFDLVGTRNSSIWWGQYSAQYSSHNVYHYQQFTLEQMILSMNLK